MQLLYTDHMSNKFPVSIKGIICSDNKFLLRKNERNEWELLGGKLEKGEIPEECLKRELTEEADINVDIAHLLDTWLYKISHEAEVLIVTYLCQIKQNQQVRSLEGAQLAWHSMPEIEQLNMPEGYKKTLRLAAANYSPKEVK